MAHANRKIELASNPRPAAALDQLRGGERRPTIYDVAERVGVSAITVSRALNGGSCSPSTREAVLKAARQIGYEPNPAAQALAARKRKQPRRRDRRASAQLSVPQMWQSYAEMMLRLVGGRA